MEFFEWIEVQRLITLVVIVTTWQCKTKIRIIGFGDCVEQFNVNFKIQCLYTEIIRIDSWMKKVTLKRRATRRRLPFSILFAECTQQTLDAIKYLHIVYPPAVVCISNRLFVHSYHIMNRLYVAMHTVHRDEYSSNQSSISCGR